jgi:hypothetical protein
MIGRLPTALTGSGEVEIGLDRTIIVQITPDAGSTVS